MISKKSRINRMYLFWGYFIQQMFCLFNLKVKIWFQNKRSKCKKVLKQGGSISTLSPEGMSPDEDNASQYPISPEPRSPDRVENHSQQEPMKGYPEGTMMKQESPIDCYSTKHSNNSDHSPHTNVSSMIPLHMDQHYIKNYDFIKASIPDVLYPTGNEILVQGGVMLTEQNNGTQMDAQSVPHTSPTTNTVNLPSTEQSRYTTPSPSARTTQPQQQHIHSNSASYMSPESTPSPTLTSATHPTQPEYSQYHSPPQGYNSPPDDHSTTPNQQHHYSPPFPGQNMYSAQGFMGSHGFPPQYYGGWGIPQIHTPLVNQC